MKPLSIVIAIAAAFILASAGLVMTSIGRPIGADIHADAQHQCPQSTDHTCGPAACVSALSWLGIDATEREMAAFSRSRSARIISNMKAGLTT